MAQLLPLLGTLAAFMSSFTWAVGITRYSVLSLKYPAWRINYTRALLSLPLFLLLALATPLVQGQPLLAAFASLSRADLLWALVSVFASYAFGDVIFMWSTQSLGVPGGLAIASTYPLWSALAGILFKGESLSAAKAAGLLLVVGGTVMVILSGQRRLDKGALIDNGPPPRGALLDHYKVGVFLALSASLIWALNAFALAKISPVASIPAINALRMSAVLVFSPLIGRRFQAASEALLPREVLRKDGGIFVFEGFCGALFFAYGLSHTPLSIGASLSSLAPVLSVPIAWLARTEKLPRLRLVGVFVVVGGVWLLTS